MPNFFGLLLPQQNMSSSSSDRERDRINVVNELVRMKLSSLTKTEWNDKLQESRLPRNRMNQLVLEYLVTEGYKEAAEKLSIETGVRQKLPTNYGSNIDDRINIREAVEQGRIADAIVLVNKLYPDILDDKKDLLLNLQQQQLIELIRNGKVEEALEFAQLNLSNNSEDNKPFEKELERTLALLAFDNPDKSPFGDLLQSCQRHRIAGELNSAILEQERKPTQSQLSLLLKLVMWSQEQLDAKKILYPKMIDLATAEFRDVTEDNKVADNTH